MPKSDSFQSQGTTDSKQQHGKLSLDLNRRFASDLKFFLLKEWLHNTFKVTAMVWRNLRNAFVNTQCCITNVCSLKFDVLKTHSMEKLKVFDSTCASITHMLTTIVYSNEHTLLIFGCKIPDIYSWASAQASKIWFWIEFCLPLEEGANPAL